MYNNITVWKINLNINHTFFTAMERIQGCSHEPIEILTTTSLSPVEVPSTDLVAICEWRPNTRMSGKTRNKYW